MEANHKDLKSVKRAGVRLALSVGLGVALLSVLPAAQAGPAVAQAVGVSQPLVDEFGQPLKGTSEAAAAFGFPVVEGDLVQIFLATDGVIYPAAIDGTPDARNQLLMTSRIGEGVAPTSATPARFGTTITPRPGGNSKIFVRVFNAPSVGEASFYGDSQLFTVSGWDNEVFLANITATDQPLDGRDSDGDGLNNSMEKSYGSNALAADSDGDGLTDSEEQVAGTDLLDRNSLLLMAEIRPAGGDNLDLVWESAPGHRYRVEYAAGELGGEGHFSTMATVEATDSTTAFYVSGGFSDARGRYRVCAIQ